MDHKFNLPYATLMAAANTGESIENIDDRHMFMSSLTEDCSLYHRVAAFMFFFGQLEKDKPLGFDEGKLELGLNLIIEEFKELFEKGLGIGIQIQYWDSSEDCAQGWTYDLSEALQSADRSKFNIVEFADALGDLKYVEEWNAIAHGIPQPLVDWEIHCSNMTKLGQGGEPMLNGISVGCRASDDQGNYPEPHYDPDKPVGKVLKGPNYVAPNIPRILGIDEVPNQAA